MSGTPTEAEIQTQLKAAVDLLETTRAFADDTLAGAGGKYDTILQALEGEFMPAAFADAAARHRATMSSLITGGFAAELFAAVIFDYAAILRADAANGFGSGYTDSGRLFTALYEWCVENSITVQSRNITFDASATAGASNVGNIAIDRLTVDENAVTLEACTVEKKTFRCRQDKNSGRRAGAEVFEFLGTQASFDALLRNARGSGEGSNVGVPVHHAGSGEGGSLLRNSSFSTYDPTTTPKFSDWVEDSGSAQIDQDTTNVYKSFPGEDTSGSLKMTGGSGLVKVSQSIPARLDPNLPYFLRVMVNVDPGAASGGTVTLTIGGVSNDLDVDSQSGWVELKVGPIAGNWFRAFNADDLSVEIEWADSVSGYIVVDDLLFAPWDLVDGTYWFFRHNNASPVDCLVDDTFTFTDTAAGPGTEGAINYWLWVSGFGSLPSTTGTPTITDP